MVDTRAPQRASVVSLPPTAPKIRITAGLGTANQKTWNLRRPVTLIGTSRTAHIVLSDDSVSQAHCIIVNTGREVLLKDLHSVNGTQHNAQMVDLVVLKDGDILQLGRATVQVAIRDVIRQADRDTTASRDDPLAMHDPMFLCRVGSSKHWVVEHAVTIIGRCPDVSVPLDHPEVAPIHAALVRLEGELVVFDLAGKTGTWVNGQREVLAPLKTKDRLKVGPFEMIVSATAEVGALACDASNLQVDDIGARLVRLWKLEADLKAQSAALQHQRQELQQQTVAIEVAKTSIENDRRALEQQAMGLWKARTQLDIERKLFQQKQRLSAGGTQIAHSLPYVASPVVDQAPPVARAWLSLDAATKPHTFGPARQSMK
ncbi:MAG: FHA domain-containing protein [Phycisphaerae bacterium]|nr:FHA domain-containing protein [Phycisphaerae bacterium]